MDIMFRDFGFYNVDTKYLKYLHDIDSEVYYSPEKAYGRKPFLGLLVSINSYTYLIPLSSGKPKHKRWKNVDRTYYLIYEIEEKKRVHKKDITKAFSNTHVIKILSVLDIKKMIPVPEALCRRIEFKELDDARYQDLLQKEYLFCKKIQDGILERVRQIYKAQKETGKVYPMYCNYALLEQACENYHGG